MSLECEGQGEVCSEHGCGQFDFLPTICDQCRRVFCYLHASRDRHASCALRASDAADAPPVTTATAADETTARLHKCAHCDTAGPLTMQCTVCNERFCAAHRFEHEHRDAKLRFAGSALSSSSQPLAVFGGATLRGTSGASPGLPVTILRISANGVDTMEACVGAGASMGKLREELLASSGAAIGRPTCLWRVLTCRPAGEPWRLVRLLSVADVTRAVEDSQLTDLADIDSSAIAQDVLGDVARPAAVALLLSETPVDTWRERLATAVSRQVSLARKLAVLLRIRSRLEHARTGTVSEQEGPTVASGTSSSANASAPRPVVALGEAHSPTAGATEVNDSSPCVHEITHRRDVVLDDENKAVRSNLVQRRCVDDPLRGHFCRAPGRNEAVCVGVRICVVARTAPGSCARRVSLVPHPTSAAGSATRPVGATDAAKHEVVRCGGEQLLGLPGLPGSTVEIRPVVDPCE